MQINTRFSCGDTIYVTYDKSTILGPFTIGLVSFRYKAAQDGPDPDSIFDNLRRQQEQRQVEYMCFETGIGSGSLWREEICHKTREEAEEHNKA